MPNDTDVPASARRYGVALVVALSGLFFVLVGDLWMAGTALALSVGSALLSWSAAHADPDAPADDSGTWATWAQLLGYASVGIGAGLLVIDVLRIWL